MYFILFTLLSYHWTFINCWKIMPFLYWLGEGQIRLPLCSRFIFVQSSFCSTYFILGKSVSRSIAFIPNSIFLYCYTYFFFAFSILRKSYAYFTGNSRLVTGTDFALFSILPLLSEYLLFKNGFITVNLAPTCLEPTQFSLLPPTPPVHLLP